jgi:lipopolysaccharide/colanic/teichoic acid biosynthesis glycosyltransferase
MYKFRTMHLGSDTAVHEAHVVRLFSDNRPVEKLDGDDHRLIRGGWFIRMAGLDELPQLLNVLRGEMSLVGPRPCLPTEARFYGVDHAGRFTVPPGITGLSQVARNGTTTFRQMLDLDAQYACGLSPWRDFGIMLRTPAALFRQLVSCSRRKDGDAPRNGHGSAIAVDSPADAGHSG